MADGDLGKRIEFVAAAVAVATATAFVISGLGNGLIFGLVWRLNYFAIAAPADIIMSAFLLGTIFATAAVPIALVVIIGRMALGWLLRTYKTASQRKALGIIAEATFTLFMSGLVAMLVNHLAFTRVEPVDSNGEEPGFGGSQGFDGDGYTGGRGSRFSYVTGLRLAPNADTGDDCWAAPVIWMGTDRVLLACSSGNRMMVNSENLLLQAIDIEVPPRSEFMESDGVSMTMPAEELIGE